MSTRVYERRAGRPETAPPGAAGPPYPFTAPVMALT
jgi:hypothetical protein